MPGPRLPALLCVLVVVATCTRALPGQEAPPSVAHRPAARWQTLRLPHFDVHYSEELEGYARAMSGRLEPIREAVVPRVGNAPRRTTVVIDETGHRSGGTVWPSTDHPLLMLWPEQRMPVLGRAQSRPELLVAHEFTHVAHGFPARNAWDRFWPRLVPPSWSLSPLGMKLPRWASEGYASYMEGQVAGSGTPHGVLRAALLRQWALEGSFPGYAAQNGDGRYLDPLMPYGVGSAFFEWLALRGGEDAFPRLWERAAGRESFERAFTEVFGVPAPDLYGRFAAEVVNRAAEARDSLASAGLVEGEIVRRLSRDTGAPHVSPDGGYLVASVRRAGGAQRVVVWDVSGGPDSVMRVRAELAPAAGRGYSEPRFLPGAAGVLVVRPEPRADGTLRSDLFVWDWRGGGVRRITRGAGIYTADPSPDARTAVADRCLRATCDLVQVDLHSGAVRTLAAGSTELVYSRPRWAPDGRSVVVARRRAGRWRIVRFDAAGASSREIDPDDGASRYAPAFMADGSVVAVSEKGGIQNLERIDTAAGTAAPITRVTGAALAPAPHPGGDLYFLRLSGHGLQLARLRASEIRPLRPVALPAHLAPVLPPPERPVADTFGTRVPGVAHPYGIGPGRLGFLPQGTYAPYGYSAGLAVARTDPVGRLTVLARGAVVEGSGWEGVSLGAAYRGLRPVLAAEIFATQETGGSSPSVLDARYSGGAVFVSTRSALQPVGYALRAGASYGRLDPREGPATPRALGVAAGTITITRPVRGRVIEAGITGHASAGRTNDTNWGRVLGTLSVRAGTGTRGVRGEIWRGVASERAPGYERFTVGGTAPSLFDPALLAQRVDMPALPPAEARSGAVTMARLALTGWIVEPYAWGASAGASYRVLGAERSWLLPHWAFARLPGIAQGRAGVGYSFDSPAGDRLRGYVSLSFRP